MTKIPEIPKKSRSSRFILRKSHIDTTLRQEPRISRIARIRKNKKIKTRQRSERVEEFSGLSFPGWSDVFHGAFRPRIASRRGRIAVTGVRSEESKLSDAGPSDDIGCEAAGAEYCSFATSAISARGLCLCPHFKLPTSHFPLQTSVFPLPCPGDLGVLGERMCFVFYASSGFFPPSRRNCPSGSQNFSASPTLPPVKGCVLQNAVNDQSPSLRIPSTAQRALSILSISRPRTAPAG